MLAFNLFFKPYLEIFLVPVRQKLRSEDLTSHDNNKTHLDASSTHILVRKRV